MTFNFTSTGSYVPLQTVSNDDLANVVETNHQWIIERTGISTRHITGGENTSDLAYHAALSALNKANLSVLDVDAILVATFTADSYTPSTACLVADKLKCRNNVLAYDINAACSGFIFACETAIALLATKRYRHILVIGAEVISKLIDYSDRNTCILFGDGAGAVLLSAEGNSTLDYSMCYRLEDTKNSLFAKGVELNNPKYSEAAANQHIIMDGKAVFAFAIEAIHQSIRDWQVSTGNTLDEIDYVVLHQANDRITSHIAKHYKLDSSKIIRYVEEVGNTSSASIPMALDHLSRNGKLLPKEKILMIGFGGGLTYGAMAITL